MKAKSSHRAMIEVAALEARRMFCAEHAMGAMGTFDAPAEQIPVPVTTAGTINTLQVPNFNSRGQASRKIYLDFNGNGAIENWNGWAFGGKNVTETPAYDIDGDTSSFSPQELANIRLIWQGVAEKFSPFDVDVTTIKPSTINGAHVVIGGDGAWNDGGGGVASVGGWGEEGFTDPVAANVCFVWGNQASPTYVAEAVAHEVGHTLHLRHQSFNPITTNEYAPGFIMGSGGGRAQWADTATDGTVSTKRDGDTVVSTGSQNDLLTILNPFLGHGFGLRPDDRGNTAATATDLLMSVQNGVNQGAAKGIVEVSSDVDFYRVQHLGGLLDVEVLPAEFTPMLDPRLQVRNSAGTILATSSTNTGGEVVGERISLNSLAAGTYFVSVFSSATYGDIGQYRLNVRGGLSSPAANDTVATATALGQFGNTGIDAVNAGFAGTALIADSLASTDVIDFYKFRAPTDTRQLYFLLNGQTSNLSLSVYHDLDDNGLIDSGDIVVSFNPGTNTQSFSHNTAVAGRTYYVRVLRQSGAASSNYNLRITAETAPTTVSTTTAAPSLLGGKLFFESTDAAFSDSVDMYRFRAADTGLLSVYLSNFGTGDVQFAVYNDLNNNGNGEVGELIGAAGQLGGGSSEFAENIGISANSSLLLRVSQQGAAASSTNYQVLAVADYATGGNTNGSLINAKDRTNSAAGSVREYLGFSVDLFDTYRINPAVGQMQARFTPLDISAGHRLEIIRDSNNNNAVDAGEIVATGFFNQLITHNVTAGANYYLRMQSQLNGEFFSIGNYSMAYTTAGAVTGSTLGAPTVFAPTSTPQTRTGFLGFDPADATLTNRDDFYQFTLASRTRFDVGSSGLPIGLQIGQLDASRNFVRKAGQGQHEGRSGNLSVNLDPGTYLLRAFLPVAERQDTEAGGNYTITFNTAAITDNAPPAVTSSAFGFEIKPVGVAFNFDQDVAGSVDAADVTIRNLGTNQLFAIDQVFYDPILSRAGYTVAGGTLPDGNYRATLLAGSVWDASANVLPTDRTLDFFVFAGDANRDRRVNIDDFGVLASHFNQLGTFSQGDFDYSHKVDIDDFAILAGKFNTVLAASGARETPVGGGQSVAPVEPTKGSTRTDGLFSSVSLDDSEMPEWVA